MDKDTKTTLKWLSPILILFVITVLFLATCHPIIGLFPESSFKLSEESRLPNWFTIPSKYSRKDLGVEIHYFGKLYGTTFKAILLGPEGKILDRETGKHQWHPESAEKIKTESGRSALPQYIIAEINGIEEVIEHRERGPIFHISDSP